mmetsp:Transcript_6635/g.24757  ORF Transcript_6635/g.24757 Transcript_6635/m.24757 type:complete len:214 (-) Transcript_6635:75-716(-)
MLVGRFAGVLFQILNTLNQRRVRRVMLLYVVQAATIPAMCISQRGQLACMLVGRLAHGCLEILNTSNQQRVPRVPLPHLLQGAMVLAVGLSKRGQLAGMLVGRLPVMSDLPKQNRMLVVSFFQHCQFTSMLGGHLAHGFAHLCQQHGLPAEVVADRCQLLGDSLCRALHGPLQAVDALEDRGVMLVLPPHVLQDARVLVVGISECLQFSKVLA